MGTLLDNNPVPSGARPGAASGSPHPIARRGELQVRPIRTATEHTPISTRPLTHDIWDRIRYARDAALDAEKTERQRLADADNADLQQAASVRSGHPSGGP